MDTTSIPFSRQRCDRSLWHANQALRESLAAQRRSWLATRPLAHLEQGRAEQQRRAYAQSLFFFYDPTCTTPDGRYRIDAFLDDGDRTFGGYDELILWQPYPRLGIDGRDQFIIWRDMPGGLAALRELIERCHERGVTCLLNYVPWDTALPRNEHPAAMAALMQETGADGVYGDTTFGMPADLARAVRAHRPDALLDCEHNAHTLADLACQTATWWQDGARHDAQVIHPQRWWTPRMMVRVVNRHLQDRSALIRDAVFHGCGLVLWENVFGWWNPYRAGDCSLARRALRILRAYHACFQDEDWMPLPAPLAPGVFGNHFQGAQRELITIRNTTDQAQCLDWPWQADASATCFDAWSDTDRHSDKKFSIAAGELAVLVRQCHEAERVVAPAEVLIDRRGQNRRQRDPRRWDGRLGFDLACRRPVIAAAGEPRPVPAVPRPVEEAPTENMAKLPAGRFHCAIWHAINNDEGGCCDEPGDYGDHHPMRSFWMPELWMDRYPVTNAGFRDFLRASGYRPGSLHRFLDHWQRRDSSDPQTWEPPVDRADHPVVWVDLFDARAYAHWAGKRLPTDDEWQYAAQGGERGRTWPWAGLFDAACCQHASADTAPVQAHPQGASPFGIEDLVGNTWEWTESERDDGHCRYAFIRGGSHLVLPDPEPSRDFSGNNWYTSQGAQPAWSHQKLLLLGPGLDRCATLGFRCVRPLH